MGGNGFTHISRLLSTQFPFSICRTSASWVWASASSPQSNAVT
uniref:Uncharacterized protein n=1 Tax=Rhizophora mucronata TaxID=61149 RepID=A0A2P2QV97_RHIMU